jgi:RNA polymerase sigma-70 factor, ECF subfamily
MERMDDRDMIQRAQAGDRQAFGVLFDAYYPRVYRYLSERLGGAPEAEDLCQEVFLTVLGSIDEYRCDGPLGFDEWLLNVAHRLAGEYYHRHHGQKLSPPAPPRVAPATGSLLNTNALSLLTDRQRQVITHRFQTGLSARQTATVLRVDPGAVRRLERSAFETWLRCAPPVEE